MAHGERAAAKANWGGGREYWARRPLAGGRGGRQRSPSTKTITHRIERARADVELRREVSLQTAAEYGHGSGPQTREGWWGWT